MPEFFSSISALTVFLAIAALGLLFLLVSFVFGEVLEDFGLSAHADGGGVDGHPFLDTRAVSVFVTAFGGFGAVGVQAGLGVLAASLLGLAGGLVLGGAVTLFGRFLYSQQSSSSFSTSQLVGRTAQVTVAIPTGGIGQVSCRVGEERVEKIARARDGAELRSGALVRIEEIAGDSAIVSAVDQPQNFTQGLRA